MISPLDQHIPSESGNPNGQWIDNGGIRWREYVVCAECDEIVESVVGWNRYVDKGNFKGRVCPGCLQICLKEDTVVKWETVD